MQCERKESNGFGANVPTAVVLDVALKQTIIPPVVCNVSRCNLQVRKWNLSDLIARVRDPPRDRRGIPQNRGGPGVIG